LRACPRPIAGRKFEILLDDSVRYAARASDVTLDVWHDMPHVFPAFPLLAESREAIDRICAFMETGFCATSGAS